MIVEIKVPGMGESITEVEMVEWRVKVGDYVRTDDPVVDVESEKATLEVPSPSDGVIAEILVKEGEVAQVGDVIARLDTEAKGEKAAPVEAVPVAVEASVGPTPQPPSRGEGVAQDGASVPSQSVSANEASPATVLTSSVPVSAASSGSTSSVPEGDGRMMPAARRILEAGHVDESDVGGTGPGGRILKEDAEAAVERARQERMAPVESAAPVAPAPAPAAELAATLLAGEHRKRMSPLRRTIARRLLQATQEMAILTTFNEVDMSAVKQMRSMLGQAFLEKNGVKLGFMSFFVRAAQYALGQFPMVNSSIDGKDVVSRDFVNIGVAIGLGRGLVVPVLRNVESMSMAQIERNIIDYAGRAQKGQLAPEELEGGTFTISNGGVYGSMLSTPIVNPPQSAILGMHAIKDRVMVVDGEMVIRPMMYVALSYDHRLIDGREAVSFLNVIKDAVEKPAGMLLEA